MSVPRLDALFHRPRAMCVVLQKFFVVIRLDHERLHLAQPFHDHFGDVTEVGDETETARAGVKHEADRIYRVVWHWERLHGDVADGKFGAGCEQSPITTSLCETTGSKRFRRKSIAINGQLKFATKNFKPANVIGVFVCENHPVELLRRDAALLQTQSDLPRTQAAINENLAVVGCDQRAVPRAPAAEHGQAEHGSQDRRAIQVHAN